MSWKVLSASFLALMLVVYCQVAIAATPCFIPPASLVSWWTGDTDASDLYGVNNPSAVNAVSLVPGEVLNGLMFEDGAYIDIPASKSLANQRYTWDAWVRPDGPGPNNDAVGSVIVAQIIDGTHTAVALTWRATDNRFTFQFGDYLASEYLVSTDAFPPGSFYFVAATYDGTAFRLYVNGVLEGVFAEKKKIIYSASTWNIGSTDAFFRGAGWPRTWNGVIDEVEAFKVALPQATIQSIYKKGIVGKCKAPVIVNPASMTFAAQTVGTTSPAKNVTVINNRNQVVILNAFTFSGTNAADFAEASTTCASTLAGRKRCTVGVTFTPKAIGKRTATLNVNDSAVGSPQMVSLSGKGK